MYMKQDLLLFESELSLLIYHSLHWNFVSIALFFPIFGGRCDTYYSADFSPLVCWTHSYMHLFFIFFLNMTEYIYCNMLCLVSLKQQQHSNKIPYPKLFLWTLCLPMPVNFKPTLFEHKIYLITSPVCLLKALKSVVHSFCTYTKQQWCAIYVPHKITPESRFSLESRNVDIRVVYLSLKLKKKHIGKLCNMLLDINFIFKYYLSGILKPNCELM